ncbi:hypothetical protein [Franzmannia qiaohouensis]|uniref:Uncharacterized protein n=1 Tax=Franzmannia qiaohouensis TaxID=1329370 RepID=A0ABU1HIN3_9GAMM|nr:hypothetical protein [Halomonas qiaohouensis]MDR5907345.1 hypothetical protein [Halomonas qiaohouensis]
MTHFETLPAALEVDVIDGLEQALKRLQERDAALLEAQANERSITARLGCHLQAVFPDWDVDCEFNCWRGPLQSRGHIVVSTTSATTEAPTIFPDLLIHRRGSGETLAVIEVLKSDAQSARHRERRKLQHCLKRLGCPHAAMIEIGVGERRGRHHLEMLATPLHDEQSL